MAAAPFLTKVNSAFLFIFAEPERQSLHRERRVFGFLCKDEDAPSTRERKRNNNNNNNKEEGKGPGEKQKGRRNG